MAVVENVQMANFAVTTLAEDVSIAETDIDVIDASDFPTITGNQYYYLTIIRDSDNAKEIVKVTSVSSNTLTVTRAQDGTSALELLTGDAVELNVTTALLDDLRDEITAELNKISFADAGATSHHDTAETNTIAKFASDASDQILIVLGAGTYTFTDDYTVAKGVTLRFEGGAQLSVASGKTVTIEGQIVAPLEDLFTGSGDVDIASGQDVPAEWYGAVSYATTGESSPVDSGTKMDDALPRIGDSFLVLTEGYYYCFPTSGGPYVTTNIGTVFTGQRVKVQPGAIMYTDKLVNLFFEITAGRHTIFESSYPGNFKGWENPIIVPEWFGAGHDATVDSSSAFQLAVEFYDSAASHADVRTELDCGGYKFRLDEGVIIPDNWIISNATFVRYTTAGGDYVLKVGNFCLIQNVMIDITNVSSGDMSGILSVNKVEVTINDCYIDTPRSSAYATGNFNSGIYLWSCDRCRITGSIIDTPVNSGIALEECENCIVDGCTIITPTVVGIDIFNGVHNRVTNCTVKASTDMGIRVAGLSSGAGSVNTAIISNNNIQTSTQEGIVIDGATANVDNILINGNMIIASSVSYTGIEFRGTVTDATVAANHIEGYDYGVGTTGATSNLLVAVNHLMGCTTETTIHSSSTNTQVLSNMKGATLTEAHAIITEDLATTAAGTGGSLNTWAARKCNKIEADTAGMVASIDGGTGEFDLVAGTYKIRAYCPVDVSDGTQSRIYDVTNSKVIANGLSVTSSASGDNDEFNISIVSGILSIGSTTTLRIETIASQGWKSCNALSSVNITNAERSVGTLVEITKISTQAISTVDLSGENHVSYELDASGGIAIGTHKIGELPDNAVVTRAWYEVITTFTDGASDTATIGFDIEGDDPLGAAGEGILEAIAINDVSNPFDDGGGGPPVAPAYYDAIQDGAVGNFAEKTTQVRDVRAIVGTAALTAGHLFLHLTFTVSE